MPRQHSLQVATRTQDTVDHTPTPAKPVVPHVLKDLEPGDGEASVVPPMPQQVRQARQPPVVGTVHPTISHIRHPRVGADEVIVVRGHHHTKRAVAAMEIDGAENAGREHVVEIVQVNHVGPVPAQDAGERVAPAV
jgi:hypothetical protein